MNLLVFFAYRNSGFRINRVINQRFINLRFGLRGQITNTRPRLYHAQRSNNKTPAKSTGVNTTWSDVN